MLLRKSHAITLYILNAYSNKTKGLLVELDNFEVKRRVRIPQGQATERFCLHNNRWLTGVMPVSMFVSAACWPPAQQTRPARSGERPTSPWWLSWASRATTQGRPLGAGCGTAPSLATPSTSSQVSTTGQLNVAVLVFGMIEKNTYTSSCNLNFDGLGFKKTTLQR